MLPNCWKCSIANVETILNLSRRIQIASIFYLISLWIFIWNEFANAFFSSSLILNFNSTPNSFRLFMNVITIEIENSIYTVKCSNDKFLKILLLIINKGNFHAIFFFPRWYTYFDTSFLLRFDSHLIFKVLFLGFSNTFWCEEQKIYTYILTRKYKLNRYSFVFKLWNCRYEPFENVSNTLKFAIQKWSEKNRQQERNENHSFFLPFFLPIDFVSVFFSRSAFYSGIIIITPRPIATVILRRYRRRRRCRNHDVFLHLHWL